MPIAAVIVGGEVTYELVGASGLVTMGAVSMEFLVWAVASAVLLILALCCWALAIRVYRVRG